jgi:sorting nexin-1/2
MHFSKSAAMLGNAEEHTALSRALSQLAETEERSEQNIILVLQR